MAGYIGRLTRKTLRCGDFHTTRYPKGVNLNIITSQYQKSQHFNAASKSENHKVSMWLPNLNIRKSQWNYPLYLSVSTSLVGAAILAPYGPNMAGTRGIWGARQRLGLATPIAERVPRTLSS